MNSDDYAKRQAQRDAEYEREYEAWVKSMTRDGTPGSRKARCAQTLPATPWQWCGGSRHGRLAAASHTPDIAALVDHENERAESHSMGSATEILRHLVADIISARTTPDSPSSAWPIALGLQRLQRRDSMTRIAKRHGITRAAVSKRCVDITERLNLPPSRAMRSEKARKIYRRSQLKRYRSQEP